MVIREPIIGAVVRGWRLVVPALALASVAIVEVVAQRGPEQNPNDQPERAVNVVAIQGVVEAGATWKLLWGGPDNADGLVATSDGGVLVAHWQGNRISKIDSSDRVAPFAADTNGTGALAIDAVGRVLGAQRSCFWIGAPADACKTPSAIGILAPSRSTLANSVDGKSLGRINELVVTRSGGVYFNGPVGLHYVAPDGKVIAVAEPELDTNGLILGRDEKVLYVTNGPAVLALSLGADGRVLSRKEVAKLRGGSGDGMTIDADERLYVTSPAGVEVISRDGTYLGLIPSPRSGISVAFAGREKKTLYLVGAGANGSDGKPLRAVPGERNNARSVYRINLIAQGFAGRAK